MAHDKGQNGGVERSVIIARNHMPRAGNHRLLNMGQGGGEMRHCLL